MKKVFEIDLDDCTEPEEQLAVLMMDSNIIVNNGWWDKSWPKDKITLHVNCNDVFAWGCADAEDVSHSELEDLFNHYKKDQCWGISVWCIKKRKWTPQPPVYKSIMKDNIWDLDEICKDFPNKDRAV